MSRVNGTEIYFSHAEICDALKNFNKEYKNLSGIYTWYFFYHKLALFG